MASDSTIAAAIASAQALDVTPAQMVALIDRLLAEAAVDGKTVATYSINGKSVTRSIDAWQRLRDYYHARAIAAAGMVAAPAEFVPDSTFFAGNQ